jgi:hypothetical protein
LGGTIAQYLDHDAPTEMAKGGMERFQQPGGSTAFRRSLSR